MVKKLGKCIDDSEISPHGYTVYRRDRGGGGVAVYHRSDIKASLLANLPSSIEHCALRITPLRGQEFIICCIYRPPSAKSEWCEHMRSFMQSLVDARLPLLIIGDINIDLMKDSSLADNLRAEYHLSQLITEPTRVTKTTATLIDHIYMSSKDLVAVSGVFEPHVSDHRLIFCTLADAQNPHCPRCLVNYRSLKGVDAEAMNVEIQAQPWSLLHAFDDIVDVVDTFYNLYWTAWDKFAPIKTKPAPKQHQQ